MIYGCYSAIQPPKNQNSNRKTGEPKGRLWQIVTSDIWNTCEATCTPQGGGHSNIKRTGLFVGNFEKKTLINRYQDPALCAWLGMFFFSQFRNNTFSCHFFRLNTPKGTHLFFFSVSNISTTSSWFSFDFSVFFLQRLGCVQGLFSTFRATKFRGYQYKCIVVRLKIDIGRSQINLYTSD